MIAWRMSRTGADARAGEAHFRKPPDLQDAAVQTVLQQAEVLSAEWARAA